ncbi:GtrA family protein [Dactylosporangium sp. NPDC000555]|uniref:GtrA family protein n=1 Tax=Dactylosporangium sp. NPDC000555 TaxID=3154260 RepID=UPI00333385DE
MTATAEKLGKLLTDRRVRYVAVGGVSSAVYYALFAAIYLTTRHHLHYLAVPVLANLGCAIVTYPLQRRWVFRATGPVVAGFLKFYVICLWALVFTYAGLPLLVELAGVPVLAAQALLIVAAPLINYQLSKFWAFRR